jgi:low temperature requirement protein LtrA
MDKQQLGVLMCIIVPIAMFAMIFGIYYLRNREKMAMIERGMDPGISKNKPAPSYVLTWGLLLIGAGLGLFVAFVLDHYAFRSSDDDNVAVYFSLIAVFGGAGLFLAYIIEKKNEQKDLEK